MTHDSAPNIVVRIIYSVCIVEVYTVPKNELKTFSKFASNRTGTIGQASNVSPLSRIDANQGEKNDSSAQRIERDAEINRNTDA